MTISTDMNLVTFFTVLAIDVIFMIVALRRNGIALWLIPLVCSMYLFATSETSGIRAMSFILLLVQGFGFATSFGNNKGEGGI